MVQAGDVVRIGSRALKGESVVTMYLLFFYKRSSDYQETTGPPRAAKDFEMVAVQRA